jgi:hypothetical protein
MQLGRDFYVGIVEDNKDPNRKGRIKVRVQTLYHNIEVADIPYAYPFAGLSGTEFDVPAIGKLVNILFLSDDLYSPYYIYSENYNENLQQKLNSLTDEEYVNFTALLFDESTQIYVKGQEFTMDQLLNKITINNNSINLEIKDNTQLINLGSKGANQDAVLGTNFFKWMDKFMTELSNPFSLVGNLGAPVLKPKLSQLCAEYKKLRPDFVSNNVKIVNNGKVKLLRRTPDTINNRNDITLVVPPEEGSVSAKHRAELLSAIVDQNSKACDTLKNAAPSTIIPVNFPDGEDVGNRKNRKIIEGLHPRIQPYVTRLINKIESELGTKITITSGYRSIEYQRQLIAQGNNDAAQPGKSYHNYGLAVDIWPSVGNKTITKSTQNNYSQWDDMGSIGKSLGFRWGKSFNEVWHFDMGFDFTTTELLQKFNNSDLVDGFVNLNKSGTQTHDQYNGQDYEKNTSVTSETAIIVPCDSAKKFNKDNTIEESHPTNSTSDEKETAFGSVDNSSLDCKEKNAKLLLDQIAEGEGTSAKSARKEGVYSPYDITYSYGKFTPKTLPSGKSVQPISTLTIGEIKEVQALMLKNQAGKNLPSSAIGRYQFISSTLNGLAKDAGMSDDTIFSPDTQDKLAIQKLISRGYNKWVTNQMGDEAFQQSLAYEWASVAGPNGKSAYNQHVGTTDAQIKDIMDQIKKSNC